MKYLILLLLLLAGCSPPQCYNTIINNTEIREIPVYVNHTIYVNVSQPDEQCQKHSHEILQAYYVCLYNLTQMQDRLDSDCEAELSKCNDTLINYGNRLDNITWYSNANR